MIKPVSYTHLDVYKRQITYYTKYSSFTEMTQTLHYNIYSGPKGNQICNNKDYGK